VEEVVVQAVAQNRAQAVTLRAPEVMHQAPLLSPETPLASAVVQEVWHVLEPVLLQMEQVVQDVYL